MDIDFLSRGIKGIMCGGADGLRYVGIGVTFYRVIAAWRSLRILLTLILLGCLLPIFYISCVFRFYY